MLEDMDEKPIEDDSIMATPAEVRKEADDDSDDAEYSQVFNEETILLEPYERHVGLTIIIHFIIIMYFFIRTCYLFILVKMI